MTSQDDAGVARRQRPTAEQRLHRIGQLVVEYAEVAERTDNGDLAALVFQMQLVFGDE